MQDANSKKIAALNDLFRHTLGTDKSVAGQVLVTRGVSHHQEQGSILQKVREFNDFNEGDDPYGQHDFGSFTVGSDKFFWKIDYYDSEACEYGAENPLACYRVLTIMLAEEY